MRDEGGADEGRSSSFIIPPSSFNADHLLDLSDDLHQIALVSHHRLDVFVSAGNFIQHAYILAAFNARSLARQIVFRKRSFGRATRHLAAGPVRAGVETLGLALPFHDERFRTHRSGDDAIDIFLSIDRALARDENLLAIVLLERDVVVMAVDRKLRFERLAMI